MHLKHPDWTTAIHFSQILTDQGTLFMSRTLKELYKLLDIRFIGTSVYRPQTKGLGGSIIR
ncbi:hypothetical protein COCON_G00020720 [Conger conger]|uniref:Integrase catalytic domain-containing protein n=1 Tax=Conger conger TaxID=82655 RepID=A0A9Q1DWT2_CONCO|nr:hypothetical protein COCON_G00020720 [Conger conger]